MSSLFDQHIMPAADKMYRYAYSILKSESNAHDVVQECLAKIWEKREKLKDVQHHEAWAMRIIRNQCYDWTNANRFSAFPEKVDIQAEERETDGQVLTEDFQKWLDLVLSKIPEKQSEIFHLREIEGMSYHEISETLDLSMNEVKVYLHRARTRVRSQLQKIEAYGIAN